MAIEVHKSIVEMHEDSVLNYEQHKMLLQRLNDILNEKAHKGVLVCGTGQGMAMAANKKPGIRAALCYNSEVTKLAREHNDANILTLGARVIDEATALSLVETFLNTDFEGSRHAVRINKIG